MNNYKKGLIFLLVSQIIWGFSPVATKLINPDFPSSLLILSRCLLGSVFLGLVILIKKDYLSLKKNLNNTTIIKILILGIVGSGITDLFLIAAIRNSGAIIATMVVRLEIPLGVLLATIYLKEKITLKIIWATILSFAGTLLISMKDSISIAADANFLFGILYGLIAAILWSAVGILAKEIFNQTTIKPIVITFFRLVLGAVFNIMLSIIMLSQIQQHFISLNSMDWSLIIFLGLFASGLGFWSYYQGLQKIEAGKTAIMLSISVAIAIFAGLLIGEKLNTVQWIGAALILTSIYLISLAKPKKMRTRAITPLK